MTQCLLITVGDDLFLFSTFCTFLYCIFFFSLLLFTPLFSFSGKCYFPTSGLSGRAHKYISRHIESTWDYAIKPSRKMQKITNDFCVMHWLFLLDSNVIKLKANLAEDPQLLGCFSWQKDFSNLTCVYSRVSEQSLLTFGRIPKSAIKSLKFYYALNISISTQINQITLLQTVVLKSVLCSNAIECQTSFVSQRTFQRFLKRT